MPPKKKVTKKATDTSKGKELFDFIRMIQEDQSVQSFDGMTDAEKKKYHQSRWMIHRFLSMNAAYSPIVNIIQKYTNMPDKLHYMFLTNMLPKGRQFNKYIKSAAEEKYEGWLIELVAKKFNVSLAEATTYLDIYYAQNKEALVRLCNAYGVDKKLIKKAKL
jgi:alpha-D-ribose 1-methylphosphonate 5-triphosphate diphosphatase PhnM